MLQEWSKAYPALPRNHLKAHALIDDKPRFKFSYGDCSGKPTMRSLLSWEYSRIWLQHRDDFVKARISRMTSKRISNDFQHWLDKRQPKTKFSCLPQGMQKMGPEKKN